MTVRLASTLLALGLAAAALTGCDADPAPTETPPPFATEEEAFFAAEATYRAYVDALNQVDLSDPETFEDVYAWTTGEANAGERRSLTRMHADGWTKTGQSQITSLELMGFEKSTGAVTLSTCVDVSTVDVQNTAGESVVAADRPDRQASTVRLALGGQDRLLIDAIDGANHEC